jgi:predicted ATP-binding protein involved in virulence
MSLEIVIPLAISAGEINMSSFITKIHPKHLSKDIIIHRCDNHLILTGESGCGKTTFLKWLHTELIQSSPSKSISGSTQEVFAWTNNSIYAYFRAKRRFKAYQPKSPKVIELSKERGSKLNPNFIQYILNLKIESLFAQIDKDIEAVKELDNWFDRFENILKKIFNDDSFRLTFDRKNYEFWMERDNKERFDLHHLSDGYSAIIDIVTELILKIENTESKSFECEGIVLIDEIEAHIHVELQKRILPLLTSFFPNVQFIVTTHSPFVLSSVESENITASN